MPELPDVETFKKYFNQKCIGQKISKVKILRNNSKRNTPQDKLKRDLSGKYFKPAYRRGKFMLVPVDGQELVFHFRMTGDIEYVPDADPIESVARALFTFDNGYELRYLDRRNIGELFLAPAHDYSKIKELDLLNKLGPEPLSNDFTLDYLDGLIRKNTARPVKTFLVNQEKIAGIGNIYADEILFQAGLKPSRTCGTLDSAEIKKLFKAVKFALQKAIDVDADTSKLPNFLLAHRRGVGIRAGQDNICPKCHKRFKSLRISGRTSVYCENDQS